MDNDHCGWRRSTTTVSSCGRGRAALVPEHLARPTEDQYVGRQARSLPLPRSSME